MSPTVAFIFWLLDDALARGLASKSGFRRVLSPEWSATTERYQAVCNWVTSSQRVQMRDAATRPVEPLAFLALSS